MGWRPRDLRRAQSLQDSDAFFSDLLGGGTGSRTDEGTDAGTLKGSRKGGGRGAGVGPAHPAKEEPWLGLRVGQQLEGTVVEKNPHGLRVDLGGVAGERMVWAQHVAKFGEDIQRLQEGDEVMVWVGQLDQETDKIQLLLSPPLSTRSLAEDKACVLAKLEAAEGGVLPYGDRMDAEIYPRVFGMSKSRFKNAVGGLFKEARIERPTGGQIVLRQTNPHGAHSQTPKAPADRSNFPKDGARQRPRDTRGASPRGRGASPRGRRGSVDRGGTRGTVRGNRDY